MEKKLKDSKLKITIGALVVFALSPTMDIKAGWNANTNNGSECVMMQDEFGQYCVWDIENHSVVTHARKLYYDLIGFPTRAKLAALKNAYSELQTYDYTDDYMEGAIAVMPEVLKLREMVDAYVRQDGVVGVKETTPDGYDLYLIFKQMDKMRALTKSTDKDLKLGYEAHGYKYVAPEMARVILVFNKHFNYSEKPNGDASKSVRSMKKLIDSTDFVDNISVLKKMNDEVQRLRDVAEKLRLRSDRNEGLNTNTVQGINLDNLETFLLLPDITIKDSNYIKDAVGYLEKVGILYKEAKKGEGVLKVEKKANEYKVLAAKNLSDHMMAQKTSIYLMEMSIIYGYLNDLEKGVLEKEFINISPLEKKFKVLKMSSFNNETYMDKLKTDRADVEKRIKALRTEVETTKTKIVENLERKGAKNVTGIEMIAARKSVSKLDNGPIRKDLLDRLGKLESGMTVSNKEVFAQDLYENMNKLDNVDAVVNMVDKVQIYQGENLTEDKRKELEQDMVGKIELMYLNAKYAVEGAERSKDPVDFNDASILVNKLSDNYVSLNGIKKSDLRERIENLNKEIVALYTKTELDIKVNRLENEEHLGRKISLYSNVLDNIKLSREKGFISESENLVLDRKMLVIKNKILSEINTKVEVARQDLENNPFAEKYNELAILISNIPNKTNITSIKTEAASKFKDLTDEAREIGVVRKYEAEKEKVKKTGNLTKIYALLAEMNAIGDTNLNAFITELNIIEKRKQAEILVLAHKVKVNPLKNDIEKLAVYISQLPYGEEKEFVANGVAPMNVGQIKAALLDAINDKTMDDKVKRAMVLLEKITIESSFENVQTAYNYIVTLPKLGKALPVYSEINIYVDKYEEAVESYIENAEKLKTTDAIKAARSKLKYALDKETQKDFETRLNKIN